MKKYYWIVCTCILVVVSYHFFLRVNPPPMLPRLISNQCWGSTALWILYNIPEVVTDIISKKDTYTKKSELYYLAELFSAMRERQIADINDTTLITNLDQKLAQAWQDFYKNAACPLFGVRAGATGDAAVFFSDLVAQTGAKEKIIDAYEGSRDLDCIYSQNAKQYIYIQSADKIIKIDQNLIIKEQQDYGKIGLYGYSGNDPVYGPVYELNGIVDSYELVAMAVGGSGHVYAYIKNQWGKKSVWYRCNDLDKVEQINAFPVDWPNNTEPWSGSYPTLLVYKKTGIAYDADRVVELFGQALSSFSA